MARLSITERVVVGQSGRLKRRVHSVRIESGGEDVRIDCKSEQAAFFAVDGLAKVLTAATGEEPLIE